MSQITTRTTTVVSGLPDERRWQGRDWLKALIAGGLALALLRPGAQAPAATAPQPTAAAAPTALAIPTAAAAPTAATAAVEAPGAAAVEPPLVLSTREAVLAGPYTIQGTGAPGSLVEVLLNGASIGTAAVGADGRWSLEATLEAGENEVRARAVDAGGAVLAASDPVTIGVQGPAAVAPVVDSLRPGAVAGPNTISGTGAPGTMVRVLVNGAEAGTTMVGPDGAWAIEGIDLPEGAASIVAEALDSAGQAAAASEPVSISLGSAAGAVGGPPAAGAPAIGAPVEGATVEPGELVVSGTAAPGAALEILNGDLVLGTVTAGADGSWSLPVALEPGTASIGVRPVGAEAIIGTPVRVTVGDAAAIRPACAEVAVGCQAWVTRAGGLRLRLRTTGQVAPDNIISTLPIGTQMEVTEGPAPADGFTWWRVRTIGGVEGWVAGENLVLQPD